MRVLDWKKINLLNFNEVEKLQNIRTEVTASCYNNAKKIFADIVGNVHVFSTKWELITFKAHDNSIKFCAITSGSISNGRTNNTNRNVLVTLEQEGGNNEIILRAFNLNEIAKRSGAPCLGTARLRGGSPVTALRTEQIENKLIVVLGFDSGSVLLHRAQINRDMSSSFHTLSITTQNITGIELKPKDSSSWNMFVCSNCNIFCYTVTESNVVADSKKELDQTNEPTTCCAMTSKETDAYFTVGCDDAVYCFTSDDRGPCYAIEGRKQFIIWFGNHLVIVVRSEYASLSPHALAPSKLVVIDVLNKIVVLNKPVEEIGSILIDDHTLTCYVIAASKKVYALNERDIQSKVRLLTKKHLYGEALLLLESTKTVELQAQVHMQYGDYLLQKGDTQAAVDEYKRTIGSVEPYRVIRQLLDSRFNKYLSQYLRALVQSDFGTADHMELLRSCDDREDLPLKISEIFTSEHDDCVPAFSDIDNFESRNESDKREPTASNISHLLKIFGDRRQWPDYRIYDYLMENWEPIMKMCPADMLTILKSLCSDAQRPVQFTVLFVPPLMSHARQCIDFLEHVIENRSDVPTTLHSALLDLYLREWKADKKTIADVLTAIEKAKKHLSFVHMVFLCRHYNCWDGIMSLDDKGVMRRLYMRHCSKQLESKEMNVELWYEILDDSEEILAKSSPKIVNGILNSLLQDKQHSLLQILHKIADNKTLTVSHIKTVFTQDHMKPLIGAEQQHEIVKGLNSELDKQKTLLSDFSKKPILFRSSICDICKGAIEHPAVYFMCQHTFHKHCIYIYAEDNIVCAVCPVSPKRPLPILLNLEDQLAENNNDIMEVVSTYFGERKLTHSEEPVGSRNRRIAPMFDQPVVTQGLYASPKNWPGRFPSTENTKKRQQIKNPPKSLNPFEDDETSSSQAPKEYDSNLNPFSTF